MHDQANAVAGAVGGDLVAVHPGPVDVGVEVITGTHFAVHVFQQQTRVFLHYIHVIDRNSLLGSFFLPASNQQQCER